MQEVILFFCFSPWAVYALDEVVFAADTYKCRFVFSFELRFLFLIISLVRKR